MGISSLSEAYSTRFVISDRPGTTAEQSTRRLVTGTKSFDNDFLKARIHIENNLHFLSGILTICAAGAHPISAKR
jgi:hypothetical protein